MIETSPGSNSIICKQLQPSHVTPPLDIILAEAATLVAAEAATSVAAAWKFEEAADELLVQMLTSLQTSCWAHTTPVVVESEAVVVGFVVMIAVVVVAGFVVVFLPFVVVS